MIKAAETKMTERYGYIIMRNPLHKRLTRELRSDFGKYLVIFLFVAGLISLVSGFLVADDSMIAAYDESFELRNIEDGNFELMTELDDGLREKLEAEGTVLYDNLYIEETTSEVDSTLRIFVNREQVNLVCLMQGHMPEHADEIAVDRMYADNNELVPGDILTVDGKTLTISGLVALSDYSAVFSNNSDMMFDAMKFGVAIMTQQGFDTLSTTHLHYSYSWKYDEKPAGDVQEKERSDAFLEVLQKNAPLINYIPQYQNQAIHFTGDDMGSDKAMFTAFLYIVIVIIAFVFAITTSNTIAQEAAVIGTLRASGYRKGELIRHYIMMPMLVVLNAALIGNILGYTVFKDYMADLYYGSYSLPTYQTRWNAEAFVLTTVIPLLILFAIILVMLSSKLSISPLQFLRRELSHRQKRKAFRLNSKLPFFTRFRFRVIFQNKWNYVTLFIGIFFADLILLFGLMFRPLLAHYQEKICDSMISDYQYVLKTPVETQTPGAEKFSAISLNYPRGNGNDEEITVYGVAEDSAYLDMSFEEGEIYISDAYADKYNLGSGDRITLTEAYGDKSYELEITGVYEYPSTFAVFMEREHFNELFGQENDYFNGYFSDQKVTDIDGMYIATEISQDDLTKVSRQMDLSMGSMMTIFVGMGVIMFLLLMYLLSKQIIEKNAQSISMAKILGYNQVEIGQLYIMSTTLVVLASLLISMPLCSKLMEYLVHIILYDFSGYLPYYVNYETFLTMILLGICSYTAVAVLQLYKIRKIPKNDALKCLE